MASSLLSVSIDQLASPLLLCKASNNLEQQRHRHSSSLERDLWQEKKEKEEATFEFLRLCSSSVRSEEQMRFNKIERSWNKCGYLTLIEDDRKNYEGTNFQVGFLIFRWKKIKFTLKLYIVYMRTWYERISFRFEFFKRFLINTWHNQRK